MKSHLSEEAVLTGLGEKASDAFAASVVGCRKDYRTYMREHPDWVADASARGLANWLNDRLWAHLVVNVEGLAGIRTHVSGATREVYVDNHTTQVPTTYRVRMKRIHHDGNISNYWTPTAITFPDQEADAGHLPGILPVEVDLYVGYEWDPELEEVMGPVIALHEGAANPVWVHHLDEPIASAGGTVVTPTAPTPEVPTVDVGDVVEDVAKMEERDN